jgi:hypothetical protein
MTEDGKQEAFLDRWSRRKREHVAEQAQQAATPPAAPQAEAKPAEPLPPVESLKPDSDFTPFMAKDVTPETRRAALKQLFTDSHFNLPDPFEPYSGDYTIEDPIPVEMLKNLNHAKRLIFDKPQPPADAQAPAEAEAQAQAHQPPVQETDPTHVAGKQDA